MSFRARRIARPLACFFALAVSVTCSDATGPRPYGPPIVSLDLLRDSITVTVGDTSRVPVVALDTGGAIVGANFVAWISRDEQVATVSDHGIATGVRGGRTVVIAAHGTLFDSTIVVVHPRFTLTVEPVDTLRALGDTVRLKATISGGDGSGVASRISWASNSDIVEVSGAGRVRALANGSAWVIAAEDGGARDSVLVSVAQRVASLSITPADTTRPLLRTQRFAVTSLDARGHAVPNMPSPSFTTRNSAIATIDATGRATATGVGIDTIVVTVGPVAGRAILRVGPLPRLRFNSDTIYVGASQQSSGDGRPLPRITAGAIEPDEIVAASLTVEDSSIARAPSSVALPYTWSANYSEFIVQGVAVGTTRVIAAAARYLPDTAVVHVGAPVLRLGGAGPVGEMFVNTTSYLYATLADDSGRQSAAVSDLRVRFHSSDTTILAVDTVAIVPSGRSSIATPVTMRNAGVATVVATADGYAPDTVSYTVTERRLRFGSYGGAASSRVTIGAGQTFGSLYFGIRAAGHASPDYVIALTQRHPEIFQIPSSVTYPGYGGDYADIPARGLAVGTDTVIATGAGFAPETLIVMVTRPTYRATAAVYDESPTPTRIALAQWTSVNVQATDTAGIFHFPTVAPVRVVVTSSNPAVIRPVADTLYGGATTGGLGDIGFYGVDTGTATLTLSDPDGAYRPLTLSPITVTPVRLHLVSATGVAGPVTLGRDQHIPLGARPRGNYPLITPNAGGYVTLASRDSGIAVPVPATGDSGFDVLAGSREGRTWIVGTGPGMTADSLEVIVGEPLLRLNSPRDFYFDASGHLSPYETGGELTVTDFAGNPRLPRHPLTIGFESSDFEVATFGMATVVIGPSDPATLSIPAPTFGGANGTFFTRAVERGSAVVGYEPAAGRESTAHGQQQVISTAPAKPSP